MGAVNYPVSFTVDDTTLVKVQEELLETVQKLTMQYDRLGGAEQKYTTGQRKAITSYERTLRTTKDINKFAIEYVKAKHSVR